MKIGPTTIEDTYAEAFAAFCARLVITAHDLYWLAAAIEAFCGYGTSIIGCDAEVGSELPLSSAQTPDGRVGAAVLAFGFSSAAVGRSVANRCGQCLLTCPTVAVFDGFPDAAQRMPLGRHLRYFGDGYQKSKRIGDRRFWRVPVMDGEFLVEESCGVQAGVAGGNVIIQSVDVPTGLDAARRAVRAIEPIAGVITPFPAGVARSGSKVGSRYPKLRASTNERYCPTLRGRVHSQLHEQAHCALEIVIDGTGVRPVGAAMKAAILAASGDGVRAISAGNYGGQLGQHKFALRQLVD